MKSDITFVFFSFNESKRIEYVIRNVAPYGRIIVFDDHSTDNTKEIVESFGVPFYTRPKTVKAFVEAPETFTFVKQYIETPWIYWGWTDNLLPRPLLERMREISGQSQYKSVHIPVYTYLWGDTEHPMSKGAYPLFFMHEYMDFSNNRIHSLGKFLGSPKEVLYLPDRLGYAIRHFSLYDVEKFLKAHLHYANIEVPEKIEDGRKFSIVYMFGSMARYFFMFYKQAWRAGVRGLYVSLLYAFSRLITAVRWYELEHNLNLETIESEFVKEKQKIVDDVESHAKK
jgi:glycosyltransferase involved in cell wall biosynthesis